MARVHGSAGARRSDEARPPGDWRQLSPALPCITNITMLIISRQFRGAPSRSFGQKNGAQALEIAFSRHEFALALRRPPAADRPHCSWGVRASIRTPFAYADWYRRVSHRSDYGPGYVSRRREPRLRTRPFRPRHRQVHFPLSGQTQRRDGARRRARPISPNRSTPTRRSSSSAATIRARSNSSATTRRMCWPRRCSRCGPTRK